MSFSYPADLNSFISAFRQEPFGAEKIIAGNFYSLAKHSSQAVPVYDPDAFDVILVEFYKRGNGADMRPKDIIDFHTANPAAIIVVNAGVPDVTTPATGNDLKIVQEAVTVAALVGGLHAIDQAINSTDSHGDSTYTQNFLDFPIPRAGKPIGCIESNSLFHKREYGSMIALYANQTGQVSLPSGNWFNFWSKAVASGSITIQEGTSYLLFKQ